MFGFSNKTEKADKLHFKMNTMSFNISYKTISCVLFKHRLTFNGHFTSLIMLYVRMLDIVNICTVKL